MSLLRHLLPLPINPTNEKTTETVKPSTEIRTTRTTVPSYGNRKSWHPRTPQDFADGGAFPEIQTPQFPLEMGQKAGNKSNAVAIQLDAEGRIKYDALARRGHHKDKIVYSKFTDLLPQELTQDDDASIQKPSEDETEALTEKTRLALEKITSCKIAAAMPVRAVDRRADAKYFRYTPSQGEDNGGKPRVIRMVEAQRDPMEPARFILNKKIPRGPPSPPAPVMHSPPRRVTAKEQTDWKIPPCISNWKNAHGYVVPLDKRIVADGRGLQQVHINENFAKLAEALYIADRKAREGIEMRAQLEKQLANKEKEKKEQHLRELATKARNERAGLRDLAPQVDNEAVERDELRNERRKERQRDRNILRAAPEKRTKLQRQRERDVSEMIALGVPNPGTGGAGMQYDERLFNQNQGIGSGFGDEDSYNAYDKPWRSAVTQSIYRPTKGAEFDGDDRETMEEIVRKKFVPDKGFAGADRSGCRSGPVQFEKRVDEDPFGLDQFLTEAKKSEAKKSSAKRGSDQRDDDGHSRSKRHRN